MVEEQVLVFNSINSFRMKKVTLVFIFICGVLKAQHQITFQRSYGNGVFDSGESVINSTDSGYVVAGITNTSSTDGLLFKTDSLGELIWWKNIGGTGIQGFRSHVFSKSNNGYVCVGYTNDLDTSGYNAYITKTDSDGNVIWEKKYGGSDWDMLYSVVEMKDTTYLAVGETYSFGNGNKDIYVIKFDRNGDTLWTKTFGGVEDDYARKVYKDRNERTIIVGTTLSYGLGGSDLYIVVLNTSGDTIWTRTHGSNLDDFGYSGDIYTTYGNATFYVFGYTKESTLSGEQEAFILRLDSMGTTVILDYSQYATNSEIVDNIIIKNLKTGEFYYTADSRTSPSGQRDICINQTSYNLNFLMDNFIYTNSDNEYPKDIILSKNRGFAITGETQSYGPGISSCFLIKVDTLLSTGSSTFIVSNEDEKETYLKLFPNPVHDFVDIQSSYLIEEISIYNTCGQLIYSQRISSNESIVNLSGYPSGLYIVSILIDNSRINKRIIIE